MTNLHRLIEVLGILSALILLLARYNESFHNWFFHEETVEDSDPSESQRIK